MKIVTYNLNGIRARLPRLIEYLDEQKPDLICLQEIKCADESCPIEDIRAAGYDGVWHGQKGFNGVAILSPADRPATLRRMGLPGDPDDTHETRHAAPARAVAAAETAGAERPAERAGGEPARHQNRRKSRKAGRRSVRTG